MKHAEIVSCCNSGDAGTGKNFHSPPANTGTPAVTCALHKAALRGIAWLQICRIESLLVF
jgi:hypothetical protein